MAYSLNHVVLLGHVGSDPDIRQFPDGGLIATLSLATTISYKEKDSEEWKDIVDWHTIKAYVSNAKTIENYVRKGHKLEIVGQLKNNNYTDDKDVKHYGYFVRVEKLILLEKIEGKLPNLPVNEVKGSSNNEESWDSDIPF